MNLLCRLLPSENTEALLGDLNEEARHRSRVWYVAQVVAMIVVSSWRDIRRHPLVALRAIGVGLLTLFVVFAPASGLLKIVRVLSEGGYYVGGYWLTLPSNTFRLLPALVNTLGFAASGWTIARFHRSHGIAMLMPFTLLACVFPAMVIASVPTYRVLRFMTAPQIVGLISSLTLPAWILVGGVLGLATSPKERQRV